MTLEKSLKIAFITENFPILSETFILFKAVALKELGHDVWIFTQRKRKSEIMHEQINLIDMKKRVVKLPVPERVRFKDITRNLRYALIHHPYRAIALAFRVARDPKASGSRLRRFNNALPFLRAKFDVIHAQFGNCGACYHTVQDTLGVPMVCSLRGNDTLLPRKSLLSEYESMFKELVRFLPGCEYLREKAIEIGCPPDRTEITFSEKNIRLYSYFDRSSLIRPRPVIFTAARLYWRKGYIYALEALRILKQRGLDFEYWIVGDGEDRMALEYAVNDLDVKDRVKFMGAKTASEVSELMREADIFLMTSVLEGQGGVVVEAQATGLPVVATRSGGVPECMIEGETGIIVELRDSKGIADALQYLIENPEVRFEMGKKGRRLAEEKFDQDKLIARLVEVYKEEIENWRQGVFDKERKAVRS